MSQKLQLPKLRKVDNNKPKKKKILLLSDDIRFHSGIATMSREFVAGTAYMFDWVQVAAGIKHPDQGKIIDLSEQVNKERGIDDAYVKLYPTSGYGNPEIVRELISIEKPDAIMIFTDPRYWVWLFQMEHEIRQQIPIVYYNIWDDLPYPFWNESYYDSCDMLLNISKQTDNIVRNVLYRKPKEDWAVQYVPHGINGDVFRTISEGDSNWDEYQKLVNELKTAHDIDFVIFWNNRNIRRKNPADVILAYKTFVDKLPEDKRQSVGLFMHTQPVDENGTDLFAVKNTICPDYKIIFSNKPVAPAVMNFYYNIADVTINIASNEGFGLSSAESIMAGTCIINNVTGGLQDQMRFEDENGKWIEFNSAFPSNHACTYVKCGNWAAPVFPSNRSIQGSTQTPYIFDDRVDFNDVADAIMYWYEMPKEKRDGFGQEGRKWMLSEESGMSAIEMCNRFVLNLNTLFSNWKPKSRFGVYTAEKIEKPEHTGII